MFISHCCRQKHMEMAATALVAATLQDKEEDGDSEGSGSDTENEGRVCQP